MRPGWIEGEKGKLAEKEGLVAGLDAVSRLSAGAFETETKAPC